MDFLTDHLDKRSLDLLDELNMMEMPLPIWWSKLPKNTPLRSPVKKVFLLKCSPNMHPLDTQANHQFQFELTGTRSVSQNWNWNFLGELTGPRVGTRTFFFFPFKKQNWNYSNFFIKLELEILHENQELPNTALYSS